MAIFLANKKYILFIGLVAVSPIYLAAQSNATNKRPRLDPWSMNGNGHTVMLPSLILDWNLGDFAHFVHFSNNEISFITTGYLQNNYNALLLNDKLDSILLQVKVGPNPFKNTIHISCNQDALIINGIVLYDEQGKRLGHVRGPFSGVQFEQSFTVYPLKQTYCFIQIQFTLGNNQQYFKTYKLIQY